MSKKLGTLVKNARTESGVTQAALAKKVKGLTASDISKIERGEKEPDKETLKELAKALGVTQTSLLEAASGTATTKTTGKTSAKTTSGKKASGKSASKTAASKKKTSASGDLKLSAAEKKLVQLYRKADADTKKTAVAVLDGTASAKDLVLSYIQAKTGNAGKTSSSGSGKNASNLQDLLGSLLGSIQEQASDSGSGQSAGKEQSSGKEQGSEFGMLGSLLENLIGKR
ncbi:MAG: helix-turn-helix domain-containing protein [Eubacterium sp.]|nr:helix-turn-helix domain-containing protein [Eubacterium sp.]